MFDRFPELNVAFAEAGCGLGAVSAGAYGYGIRAPQRPGARLQVLALRAPQKRRHFIHCELEDRGIAQAAELLCDDILFCATDFPHEPRAGFRESVEKFNAREDVRAETKHNLMFENPKRMYPLAFR